MLNRLHNPDLGILFIRIALGVVFIIAGFGKVSDMAIVISGFATLGFGTPLAYLVAYTELMSGIALILGIFVRYAGVLISIIMAVAIWKVHFTSGFSLQNGGYEYTFVLLLCSLSVLTLGGGKYCVKNLFKKN